MPLLHNVRLISFYSSCMMALEVLDFFLSRNMQNENWSLVRTQFFSPWSMKSNFEPFLDNSW